MDKIVLGLTADDLENIAWVLHVWKSSDGTWHGGGTADWECDEDSGKTIEKLFDAMENLERSPKCTVKAIRVNDVEIENAPDVMTYEEVVRIAGFPPGSKPTITCNYTSLPGRDAVLKPGKNVRTCWGTIFTVTEMGNKCGS